MKDIRRETGSTSRSNRVPIIRANDGDIRSSRDRSLESKVEAYERGRARVSEIYENTSRDDDGYKRRYIKPKSKKSWKWEIYSAILLIGLAVVIYLMTFVWNKAEVNIKVRSENVSQNSLVTFNNNQATSTFERYELEDLATTQIKKSNSTDVKSKANGYVYIYNASDKDQRLVKNTRLSTNDGKIYRIDSTIIVPKMTSSPGSVKVLAYADTYGEDYNIAPTTLKIPGLKGGIKYDKFSAKNEDPMKGGYTGKRYLLSDQDIKDAESKLLSQLELKLREKMLAYDNKEYVVVKDSISFVPTNNREILEKQADLNTYEQKVKASMIMIKRDQLSRTIAKLNLSGYNGEDKVDIRDIKDLKVYLAESLLKSVSTSSVQLGVEYKGNIKWLIDIENIKNELLGKNISEFSQIMAHYVGVDTAKPVFSPMWVHVFPKSIKSITINLE